MLKSENSAVPHIPVLESRDDTIESKFDFTRKCQTRGDVKWENKLDIFVPLELLTKSIRPPIPLLKTSLFWIIDPKIVLLNLILYTFPTNININPRPTPTFLRIPNNTLEPIRNSGRYWECWMICVIVWIKVSDYIRIHFATKTTKFIVNDTGSPRQTSQVEDQNTWTWSFVYERGRQWNIPVTNRYQIRFRMKRRVKMGNGELRVKSKNKNET